jgi:hypothetical protein
MQLVSRRVDPFGRHTDLLDQILKPGKYDALVEGVLVREVIVQRGFRDLSLFCNVAQRSPLVAVTCEEAAGDL